MGSGSSTPRGDSGVASPTVAVTPDPGRFPETRGLRRGTEIGRYVVLDKVGQGGMGAVYRAYDTRLRREVALKQIRAGFYGPQAESQLLAEAQAMAQLSHPNVAAVYDVELIEGAVVLAMEFVSGQTLHAWLRESSRSWQEVVRAFMPAGRGLQAAHRVGVVHRDFKPSNVLVGDDGRTRVVDFGLARSSIDPGVTAGASDERVGAESAVVAGPRESDPGSLVMGTPQFMAPEQHAGKTLDARADQYAFCVALWYGLCGQYPFSGPSSSLANQKRAGPPPWPSAQPVPRRVVEAVRRGLSTDPAERFEAMDGLLTVLSQEPSRARRWVFGAAGASLVVLFAGVAIGRQRAEAGEPCGDAASHLVGVWDEARRAGVERSLQRSGGGFAEETWKRVSNRLDAYAARWTAMHEEACRATSVRGEQSHEVLDRRMRCLARLRDELEMTVNLLGEADISVATQAVPLTTALGDVEHCADLDALDSEAAPPSDPVVAEKVEQIRRNLVQAHTLRIAAKYAEARTIVDAALKDAEETGYLPVVAETALDAGRVAQSQARFDDAESALRRAFTLALEHRYDAIAADAVNALAVVIGRGQGRAAEGKALVPTVLALARRIDRGGRREADALSTAGVLARAAGEQEEALSYLSAALEIEENADPIDRASYAAALGNLGVSLAQGGRFEEAEAHMQRCLEVKRELYGEDHPAIGLTMANLAALYEQSGDAEQAIAITREALAIQEAALGPDHPAVGKTLGNLSVALDRSGATAEAVEAMTRSLAISRTSLGADNPEVAGLEANLAGMLREAADLDEAERLYRHAYDVQSETYGEAHPTVAVTVAGLAMIAAERGDYDEAISGLERALELKRAALGDHHHRVAVTAGNLATTAETAGRPARALEAFRQATEIFAETVGPEDERTLVSQHGVARTLVALGRGEEAEALLRGLAEAARRAPTRLLPPEAVDLELARALWQRRGARGEARRVASEALASCERSACPLREQIAQWVRAHGGE